MRGRQIAAATVVALVGLALALLALLPSRDQLQYTNNVPIFGIVAVVGPGDSICRDNVPLAKGSDAIRLFVYSKGAQPNPGRPAFGAPPLRLTATGSGATVRGGLSGGYGSERFITIPMQRTPIASKAGRFCIRNAGTAPLGIGGQSSDVGKPLVTVGGKRYPLDFEVDVLHRDRSRLSVIPAVMRRASIFAPSWAGPWLFYLVFAVALVVFPLAIRLTLARDDSAAAGPAAPGGERKPEPEPETIGGRPA